MAPVPAARSNSTTAAALASAAIGPCPSPSAIMNDEPVGACSHAIASPHSSSPAFGNAIAPTSSREAIALRSAHIRDAWTRIDRNQLYTGIGDAADTLDEKNPTAIGVMQQIIGE